MGIVKIDIIRADFTRLNKIQSQNSVKQASWTLFENRFLKISNQSVHNWTSKVHFLLWNIEI